MESQRENIDRAAEIIKLSKHTTVFTGAGISVESGISPFRGVGGLWNKYDPGYFEIDYFLSHPEHSWQLIKEIFYEHFGRARPNAAHICIAALEEKGYVKAVITQNIDNLHQEAGTKTVYEFHGNSQSLSCLHCKSKYSLKEISFEKPVPGCPVCAGILKSDFVFFGEPIPEEARRGSFSEAFSADVFLLIGTTGEVMPAAQIPFLAKSNGAKIIEINVEGSNYTYNITDIFLQGKAAEVMSDLYRRITCP